MADDDPIPREAEAFTVRIAFSDLRFEADASTPLVAAAEAAGIRLRTSCRAGTCRTCMCRLVSGSVTYLIEWPGLSAEEKADRLILPCVACAAGDLLMEAHNVELVDSAAGPR